MIDRPNIPMINVMEAISIFRLGKDHPKYIYSRDLLREVYGRYFILGEYVNELDKDTEFLFPLYKELWEE